MRSTNRNELAVEVTVAYPSGWSRWRWMICYWLLRLAARVYPFEVQFYRREDWYDRDVAL